MPRLAIILIVAAVIFTVYAVVDCAFFDRGRIRALPQWVWILLILLLPILGAALWFAIGRGRKPKQGARPTRSLAPDDDLEFLGRLGRDAAQEERIKKLEEELADLDDDRERGDGQTPPTRPNG
ncbi:PLDc N-terminal domain-containing protein [Agromyces atrinae]|uniref:Cardiolipin synthase N-terminal domain-containing protein n=1 Tax=Agromyces atrinae TaxID=592376 RepID=A0A4Q2M443_9MICO|nr:PLDc N-terminal domain-containing protein [Agromyces atrinae]NYD67358.1 hypothetical protein [Agromyces atrinae]RXZ86815.1 hypothetical protein ESP50_07045 [Agromyces atrinae]